MIFSLGEKGLDLNSGLSFGVGACTNPTLKGTSIFDLRLPQRVRDPRRDSFELHPLCGHAGMIYHFVVLPPECSVRVRKPTFGFTWLALQVLILTIKSR